MSRAVQPVELTAGVPAGQERGVPDRPAALRPWRLLRFGRRATFWTLLLLVCGWLLLFFVAPLTLIAVISFRPELQADLLQTFSPTLGQYDKLLDKPAYLRLFLTSIGIAFAVAAVATILAYPLAYFLVFRAGRRSGLYLLLLLLPFWTSYLLR